MRYAVISDIHSNFEALSVVLAYLKANPVDRIISCGDIVGYGPNPKECIDAVRALTNFESTLGNHDAAIAGKIDFSDFNKMAQEAVRINKALLTSDDYSYLAQLKDKISENDALFLHGSPRDPINEYLFLVEKFEENMERFREKVCFIGHTHQPLLYEFAGNPDKSGFYQTGDIFNLDPDKRYIVNVGSVGQPRDNNPMACLYFYDSKHMTVSVKRLPYETQKTSAKMMKLKLPAQLAQRLIMGV
jgi:predicted phosphodiesterase